MRDYLRRNRAVLIVIAVLVVVTVAVRAPDAITEAFWWDEVYSGRVIEAPTVASSLGWVRRESSPPLWSLLARTAHEAGSGLAALSPVFDPLGSPVAVRLLSVLMSAGLVALTVLYARRFLPLWAAALAGLIVALGFQFVLHGRELRAYALLMLLAAALPLVLEWVVELPVRRRLIGLAAFVMAGSMTHYFFLLCLFTGFVWLWLTPHERSTRLRITAAAAAGLVPLLIWSPVLITQAERVSDAFQPFGVRRLLGVYSSFFAGGSTWQEYGAGFAGRVILLVAVLAGAALLARRAEGRLCALLVVVPWIVTALIWVAGMRIFNTRNLLVVAPFAAIALSALVAAIPLRPLAYTAGIGAVALVVWTYSLDRKLGRTPYDEIGPALVELGWDRDSPLILHAHPSRAGLLAWYLPGRPFIDFARPAAGICEHAFVLAEGQDGRAWLATQEGLVEEVREFPYYGAGMADTRRGPDLAVARLAFSRETLDEAAADGAYLIQTRGRPQAPCLASQGPLVKLHDTLRSQPETQNARPLRQLAAR